MNMHLTRDQLACVYHICKATGMLRSTAEYLKLYVACKLLKLSLQSFQPLCTASSCSSSLSLQLTRGKEKIIHQSIHHSLNKSMQEATNESSNGPSPLIVCSNGAQQYPQHVSNRRSPIACGHSYRGQHVARQQRQSSVDAPRLLGHGPEAWQPSQPVGDCNVVSSIQIWYAEVGAGRHAALQVTGVQTPESPAILA